VTGIQRKRHLGEGEEAYAAAGRAAVFEHAGVRFAIAICAEAGFDAPFDAAAWQNWFSWWQGCGLGDARRQAGRLGLWIALAGQAGATVDEDFPGLAALVSPAGAVTSRLPGWRPGTLIADVPLP
jgi:predicted amidohydrolase